MLSSTFEAEDGASASVEIDGSTLRRPLLPVDFLDGDGTIVTQMNSTLETIDRRTRYRMLNRRKCLACSFIILSLLGLLSSGWSTLISCNLVAVRYPTGGLQLLVTAFGFWSYQQKVVQNNHEDSTSYNNEAVTKTVCVNYDGIQKNHHDVDVKDFFPVNETIQTYAILSVSFYTVGMLATILFLLIALAHPEVFTGSESKLYPATGMTGSVAAATGFFFVAGVFHVRLVADLLHFSSNSINSNSRPSSICDPTHSLCHLGLGGYGVVITICTSFVCGMVALVTTHNVRRIRSGKSSCFYNYCTVACLE